MDNTRQIKTQVNNRNDEIDLLQLLYKIKTKWYEIVVGLLVGCIAGVLYNTFMITPQYTASTMIYMRTGNKTISVSDLTLSQDLNSDYEIIFKSRPNLENVIADLSLDMTTDALKNALTVASIDDTRIIRITAQSSDPYLAKDIANSLAKYGVEMVKEVDSQAPYVIETAIASNKTISDSLIKSSVMFGGVGAILAAGLVVLMFFVNDTVESAEDLEKIFGHPVLTIVTEDKVYQYDKRHTGLTDRTKKRKHKK